MLPGVSRKDWLVLAVAVAASRVVWAQEPDLGERRRPDEMADLVAVELTPSTLFPRPQEAVKVTAKVRNRATHPEPSVVVALFNGSERIASKTIDMAAFQTQTLQFPWKPEREGACTLTLRVDPDLTHLELDRNDNEISVDAVVARPPPAAASFAVSEVSFVPGQPGLLRATVENTGHAPGSVPLVLRVGDRIAARRLVTLKAGEKQTVEVPWSMAALPGLPSAEINPRFHPKEGKPAKSSLSSDARAPVDLRIEDVSISAARFDPKRPRQITISFRIRNAGRDAITRPFRTSIFPGQVAAGATGAAALGAYDVTTKGLAAGSSVYVSRTVVSPVGEFEVKIETDVDHKLDLPDRAKSVVTSRFENPVPGKGRWVSIGPSLIRTKDFRANGRVTAIAIDPTATATLYVGALGSGVWKTTDGGASWAPITDSLPSLDVAAIAVDPSAPSRVYAAFANTGVFGSADGGVTWTQLSNDLGAEIRWGVLLVNPSNSNLLYLAAATGIFRSADAGASWQLSKSGGEATDLVMDPTNPSILYAALAGQGIFRTTTGGAGGNADWVKLTAGLPTSDISQVTLALCRAAPATVYAGYSRSSGFQVFRTTDGGANWSLQSTPGIGTLFNDAIGADIADADKVFITGVDIFRSTNGGVNFSQVIGTHGDHHAFANDPVTASVIYIGDDGGIFQSTNGGDSWTFIGEGMTNTEFYDIADAATQADIVIGGTQDNGNIKTDGSSTVWSQIGRFGDGATVDIDTSNAQIMYGMGQGIDSLARSTDGGSNWANIAGGLPGGIGVTGGCAVFNTYYQVHPGQPSTLLASPFPGVPPPNSCGALFQTTDPQPPGNWAELFRPPTGSILRSAVDPKVNLFYAAANDGKIYAGPGGANWQTVFTHPNGRSIRDLRVDGLDPSTVFAAFSGSGVGRVYRLRRSSAAPTSMTATDITSDLPSGLTIGQGLASGGALAIDRLLPQTIYVGTNKGVYRGRSFDGGNTWFWDLYSNGMPAANVIDLEIHPTTGTLRAATFGRAAFEINTDDPIGSLLGAEGKLTLLRVHDLGTGYGPPNDFLDVEVVAWLDSMPGRAFGFQLRDDANKGAHRGMLSLLRKAFKDNRRVHFDYFRTGFRNGRIIRAWVVP